MTFIKGHDDPVYTVNSCFTQIFQWRTKNTLFVTIFPWGCTEFPEFSMFRKIPEYSRFVATLWKSFLEAPCIQQQRVHQPAAMSSMLKIPTLTSPLTFHFCVSQFGWQLWLINRAKLPCRPASMILCDHIRHEKCHILKTRKYSKTSNLCQGFSFLFLAVCRNRNNK